MHNEHITKAIAIVKQRGIVIFPTDTAFAISTRIDTAEGVKRLFALRRRPETKATPVLVDTVSMAQHYLRPIPKKVIDTLIEPYWPGALTIVLPAKSEKIPSLVRGGSDTLGVRIPNHAIARAIIRGVGVPLLGPSANFAGEQTPFTVDSLDKDLISLVDYVVPGVCTLRQASTVVDCSITPWRILRQGAVTLTLSE